MHVLEIQSTVPEALSSLEVQGADGSAHVLRDFWAGQPCLLVFLRHFGCIGCSENVRELAPRLPELKRLGVRTVFIGCGAPFFIPPFQERHNLLHAPVELFSDISLETYRAAGLAYGLWEGFRPRSFVEMGRAFTQGNVQRASEGDLRQHAGAVLIDQGGCVRFYHRNQSVGDHAPLATIMQVALSLWATSHPEVS